jgi:flagellar biosynthesis/type III secretory pathway chaperone
MVVQQEIQILLKFLSYEEKLYKELVDVLDREKKVIESFTPDKLSALTQQRDNLTEQLSVEVQKRRKAQESFLASRGGEPGENSTLSEIVKNYCTKAEQALLEPRIKSFKSLVSDVLRKSNEFNKLVAWSIDIVGGSLSILRSVTQEEVKGYGRKGNELTRYHPKYGKDIGTLKEI